jgi:hypothetical protein
MIQPFMPFKNIQKTSKKTKKCLYSNGKMIINIDQPWDLDGFWGSYFQTNNSSKSRHINLRRRNRASVWRSRQYFCSTISERLAGSGIHTPRKPMAKIGPKRAKLRVFFRVKHVKGPTFEYHDF